MGAGRVGLFASGPMDDGSAALFLVAGGATWAIAAAAFAAAALSLGLENKDNNSFKHTFIPQGTS